MSPFTGEGARSPGIPGERGEVMLREGGRFCLGSGVWKRRDYFLLIGPLLPQIENPTPPPGPATRSREQRGESCLIVFLPCQRLAPFPTDFLRLPRDSSRLAILGAFTSHLVLALFPLAFSPPSSIPTSHSVGVQVRAFPQLLPASPLNLLSPASSLEWMFLPQLSSLPQVWI